MRAWLLVLALLIPASVLAEPKFTPFYAKEPFYEGSGGAMEVVREVEFWSLGSPPRKFELLGYLKDKRHRTGIVGNIRMAGLQKAIAKAAKEHGGDAVILLSEAGEMVGAVSIGTATVNGGVAIGTGTSTTMFKHHSLYAVIRYPKP